MEVDILPVRVKIVRFKHASLFSGDYTSSKKYILRNRVRIFGSSSLSDLYLARFHVSPVRKVRIR